MYANWVIGYAVTLVQEDIKGIEDVFNIKSKKKYENINEFLTKREDTFNTQEPVLFSTDFEIYKNLPGLKEYTLFNFFPFFGKFNLGINTGFSTFLSKNFNTEVYDVIGSKGIWAVVKHKGENNVDALYYMDENNVQGIGKFSNLAGKTIKQIKIMGIISNYFINEKIDLEFLATINAAEHTEYVLPFYLKGKPQILLDYLEKYNH